jgi:hypothetical protein
VVRLEWRNRLYEIPWEIQLALDERKEITLESNRSTGISTSYFKKSEIKRGMNLQTLLTVVGGIGQVVVDLWNKAQPVQAQDQSVISQLDK